MAAPRLLFLPGAAASAAFWRPVADRIGLARDMHFFSWPGLGHEAPNPAMRGIDDLVGLVLRELEAPADLVAQSMGGYIAVRAALEAPGKVRRLVLTVTSAGVPMEALGATDWRATYYRTFPKAAPWLADMRDDLTEHLRTLDIPVLLLWGDADPISPVAVGQRLLSLLPQASLHVVAGGDHDLARARAEDVAPLIAAHIR